MGSEFILKAMLILTTPFVADAKTFKKPLSVYGSAQCATDNATAVIPLSELQLGFPPDTPDAVRCAFACGRYIGCVVFNCRELLNGGQCELYTFPPIYCGIDVSCQCYQVSVVLYFNQLPCGMSLLSHDVMWSKVRPINMNW